MLYYNNIIIIMYNNIDVIKGTDRYNIYTESTEKSISREHSLFRSISFSPYTLGQKHTICAAHNSGLILAMHIMFALLELEIIIVATCI